MDPGRVLQSQISARPQVRKRWIDVNPAKQDSRKIWDRPGSKSVPISKSLVLLLFCLLFCSLPAFAQAQGGDEAAGRAIPPDATGSVTAQIVHSQTPGTISGTVVDQSGAIVAGAQVTLTRENQSPDDQSVGQSVGGDGRFSFGDVAPGPFQLTITAPGLATQTLSIGRAHV